MQGSGTALKYKPGRYQLVSVNRRLERNLRATKFAKQELEALEEQQADLTKQMQAKRLQLQELHVRHEALLDEFKQATSKTFAQVDNLRCADVTGLPAEIAKNPYFADLLMHPAIADFTKAIAEAAVRAQAEGHAQSHLGMQGTASSLLQSQQQTASALEERLDTETTFTPVRTAKSLRISELPYSRPDAEQDDSGNDRHEDSLEVFSPAGGQLAGSSEAKAEQRKSVGASSAGADQPQP